MSYRGNFTILHAIILSVTAGMAYSESWLTLSVFLAACLLSRFNWNGKGDYSHWAGENRPR